MCTGSGSKQRNYFFLATTKSWEATSTEKGDSKNSGSNNFSGENTTIKNCTRKKYAVFEPKENMIAKICINTPCSAPIGPPWGPDSLTRKLLSSKANIMPFAVHLKKS